MAEGNTEILSILRNKPGIDSGTESDVTPDDDHEKEHIAQKAKQQTRKEPKISIPWIKSDLVSLSMTEPPIVIVSMCVSMCVCMGTNGGILL